MDASETALALLQWNSVLAVTYPARQRYNIQRGDSWEAVHRKSQGGKCHAVHVPILKTAPTTTTMSNHEDSAAVASSEALQSTSPASLDEEYHRLYSLSEDQQQEARQKELGVRKFSNEGKACIECFRIASAKIFETVHQCLQEHFPLAVLERASIDEFFLDATSAVLDDSEMGALDLENERAFRETVVIGKDRSELQDTDSADDNCVAQKDDTNRTALSERISLQRGCWIAHQIRKVVYETLGFTMSAGISVNKTIAKLAASYGKPAGQAVCFPSEIPDLLQNTQIRKCRNLGGKLGASIQTLLPSDAPTTVGSIARYLSLPTLRAALSDTATAEWVYHIARGVDHEMVQAKTQSSAVLTKSITSFKSLNFAPISSNESLNESTRSGAPVGHSVAEAARWIELVAQEVVTRVERDTARNHRYPRSCTIQYAADSSVWQNNHRNKSKSIRIAFPSQRLPKADKVAQLVLAVPKAIESKEENAKRSDFRLHRVGLCATDFEERGAGTGSSIQTYFTATAGKAEVAPVTMSNSTTTALSCSAASNAVATSAQAPVTGTKPTPERIGFDEAVKNVALSVTENAPSDADLEYARKLQAQYDRENRGWQALESKAKKRRLTETSGSHRIDGFFQKKT